MKEPNRILFISQEIYPYLAEESSIRMLNRRLPELFQSNGFETRTFMPKFGEINERRNQLHEVIRLSGSNLVIEETDHQLLIKVASIQSARIQIYFIDNDDYFHRRRGIADASGKEWADNDERCIFFARGTVETIKKLCWVPQIVHCSGWMSAVAPILLSKASANTQYFQNTKIVVSLDNNTYQTPFSTKFAQKLQIDGLSANDVRSIAGFPVGYEELMRLAIDNAHAVVLASDQVNKRLVNYAETSGKPILYYQNNDPKKYLDFYSSLLANSADAE